MSAEGGNRACASREAIVIGIVVAVLAIALGGFGPRFVWRGVAALAAIMIVAGVIATLLLAQDAETHGLQFDVTPWSIVAGLAGQAAFALCFYGIGALGWRLAAFRRHRGEPIGPA